MRFAGFCGLAVLISLLAGGDVAGGNVAGGRAGVIAAADGNNAAPADAVAVDVELVLAVDVSYSMDMDELAAQREGYANALVSADFLRALKSGTHGRIAVTYFEWASAYDQKIIVSWRMIEGPETADAVAREILAAPIRRAARTSISGAIAFAMPLFNNSGFKGERRVIDISGDGPNNNGMPVTVARDEAITRGFTINGLPLIIRPPSAGMMDIANLDAYYEDCVIGGPGAFVVPVKGRESFLQAIRTKLIREIASPRQDARVMPAAIPAPRVNCMIGETLWQRRFDP